MTSNKNWVDEAIVPIGAINRPAGRTLADLPEFVPPGAREVAQVTAVRAAQAATYHPMMCALEVLSKLGANSGRPGWFALDACKTSEIHGHSAAEDQRGLLSGTGRRHGLQVEGRVQRWNDAQAVEELAADLVVCFQSGEQCGVADVEVIKTAPAVVVPAGKRTLAADAVGKNERLRNDRCCACCRQLPSELVEIALDRLIEGHGSVANRRGRNVQWTGRTGISEDCGSASEEGSRAESKNRGGARARV
jgi:hypothetical protein